MQDRAVGDLKAYRHRHRKSHHQIDGHCHIVTHSVIFFRTDPLCHGIANHCSVPLSHPVTKTSSRPSCFDRRQRPHRGTVTTRWNLRCYKTAEDVFQKQPGYHKLYDQLDRTPRIISRIVLFPRFFPFPVSFLFLFSLTILLPMVL